MTEKYKLKSQYHTVAYILIVDRRRPVSQQSKGLCKQVCDERYKFVVRKGHGIKPGVVSKRTHRQGLPLAFSRLSGDVPLCGVTLGCHGVSCCKGKQCVRVPTVSED